MEPCTLQSVSTQVIKYVQQYWESLDNCEHDYSRHHLSLAPSIKSTLPDDPPDYPTRIDELLDKFSKFILPSVHHWQSPLYFAYFPASTSFASVAAEIMIAGIGGASFGRASNPAFVDLEWKMMNWLVKATGLPALFLNAGNGEGGGGVIHQAASESTLLSFVLAKQRLLKKRPLLARMNQMVAFASELAHCSVQKTCVMLGVQLREVKFNYQFKMTGHELEIAIEHAIKCGLVPLIVVATLGTTSVCSFDDLVSVGNVCSKYNLWLHVDAAYAGTALVCPELRYFAKGINKVDSLSFNLHKNGW